MRYAPWKVNENDEKADGEVLVAIKLTDEEIAEQVGEREREREIYIYIYI